jgi:cob(I)alamin adenosyltransferase
VKIYTKTGDTGETSLFDQTRRLEGRSAGRCTASRRGERVSGRARAAGVDADLSALIESLRRDLFALGARLADPSARIAGRVTKPRSCGRRQNGSEGAIDRLEDGLPPLRRFILPGGSPAGSLLHLARTVCRRAERRVIASAPTPSNRSSSLR